MAENLVNSVTIYNVSGLVYVTSDILANEEPAAKAAELTTLLKSLLSVGIYDSVESAQKKGVPPGTFILVDDPETEETDFTIEIVGEYTSEEDLKRLETARLAAEKFAKIDPIAPSE